MTVTGQESLIGKFRLVQFEQRIEASFLIKLQPLDQRFQILFGKIRDQMSAVSWNQPSLKFCYDFMILQGFTKHKICKKGIAKKQEKYYTGYQNKVNGITEDIVMDQRPNIILLMADQMRGDCLGIAGHPDVKTPFLDSLAAEGVQYPNAFSACPTCVPARATLYTGMGQRKTGRVGYEDLVPWNYEHTLAGELSKAGYYTQCVGKMHVHPLRNNLGFHNVRLHDGYLHAYRAPDTPSYEDQRVADDYYWWLKQELGVDADPVDTGMDCNSWVARPWIYEEKYHPTNWVASECLDFLRRRDRSKPFFLMASFVRPHPPLDAPRYYFDLYNNRNLAEPYRGDWNDEERMLRDGHSYHAQSSPSDPKYIRQLRVGYYGAITHMDHQIGRLISALVEQKLMDNTVILFVSDHGEMLGDHLMFQKAKPYQGSIQVPMFISGPERLIGKHRRVCGDLVELRDVMPTLLDLAGAEIPDTVDGKSMLHPIDREYIHGEHSLGMDSMHFLVTKTDKYIWYSQTGRELYFDLEKDPHETHDAIADGKYADRIAWLRQCLIRELDGREEGYSDGAQLITGRPPQTVLRNITR